MQFTARRTPEDTPRPKEEEVGTPGRRPRKRWARRVGIAVLALVAVVAALASANLLLEKRERSTSTPYGERVPVAGGAMNVWRSGGPGPTIVLLSGLGTPAPALDFAPLVREFEGYDVIVVEGFGYGYSDMKARPRTVENITAEIHEVLSKLKVQKPFVLVGHSISGFYTLSYASQFPEEVSAVIGIDPTVPAAKTDAAQPVSGGVNWGRVFATAGVVRAAITIAPGLAEPPSDAYSAEELARMRQMTIWNYSNPALVDETARMGSNAAALRGVTYPDAMPVLDILAKESVSTIPRWVELHEEQLSNVRRHEVVVLDGRHYLHWTKAREMAEMIIDFIEGK